MILMVIWAAHGGPTLVPILGLAGTVITAIAGAFVAVNLNKNEKKQSAETVLEKAFNQRLALRDERLADKDEEIKELEEELKEVTAERDKVKIQRDRLYLAIAEQRAEERTHNGDS